MSARELIEKTMQQGPTATAKEALAEGTYLRACVTGPAIDKARPQFKRAGAEILSVPPADAPRSQEWEQYLEYAPADEAEVLAVAQRYGLVLKRLAPRTYQ